MYCRHRMRRAMALWILTFEEHQRRAALVQWIALVEHARFRERGVFELQLGTSCVGISATRIAQMSGADTVSHLA